MRGKKKPEKVQEFDPVFSELDSILESGSPAHKADQHEGHLDISVEEVHVERKKHPSVLDATYWVTGTPGNFLS